MELYQIRHFVAVAETGSFTRAAVRVGVSQPALSASIAKLEEEFGLKLLHRTPKAITPTDAGRRFLATAREVTASCNRIKAELRASASDRPLRIGVLRTLPSTHLAELIATFKIALPDTTIELYDGSHETLETRLSQQKVAACITSAGEKREGIESIELLREGYCLVVGLGHRLADLESIALEELQGERFIVRTHCETFGSTTQLLVDRSIRTHVVFKTDQDDRALSLIAAGLGVALMPASFEADNVRQVKVRDFQTERVIALEWNIDTFDERLEKLIAYVTSYKWSSVSSLSQKIVSMNFKRPGPMVVDRAAS